MFAALCAMWCRMEKKKFEMSSEQSMSHDEISDTKQYVTEKITESFLRMEAKCMVRLELSRVR